MYADHYHYDYADSRHDHRGQYADERHDHGYDYAEKHHRHYDDENYAQGTRADLNGLQDHVSYLEDELRDEIKAARAEIDLDLPVIKANLASLNEIVAELVDAVSDDPEFAQLTRDKLRDHSWALGYEFQGEAGPAGEPDNEPEPQDHDPGPEVDDEGGMSEYRYMRPRTTSEVSHERL